MFNDFRKYSTSSFHEYIKAQHDVFIHNMFPTFRISIYTTKLITLMYVHVCTKGHIPGYYNGDKALSQ